MQDFSNGTIDLDTLPKYEEVQFNPLSAKYWNVVVVNLSIFLLCVAIGLVLLLISTEELGPYLYVSAGSYVAFAAFLFVVYKASVKRRGFALREKDLIYKSGIIALSTTIIPFSRIQHISLDEGVVSRFYKLGKLQIFTAGGSSGSLHISGLDIEQAKTIKEILMKQINQADQP